MSEEPKKIIRLTEKVRASGWAAKLGPEDLEEIVGQLTFKPHPNLIVGMETADDAGVFRVREDLALIQTLDFFTPIVDDPYDFGRIAAANALSDVYAMGGVPVTAMNIVCFPIGDIPKEILAATLAGGLEKIHEAGAALVGGHSVDDKEFKYGLSVTGTVHPEKVLKNYTVNPGDRLILTKPVGTGVLATAIKGGLAGPDSVAALVETAAALNRAAAEIILPFGPSALTDVTGFGLAGHALEMARGSDNEIEIQAAAVPLLPEVYDFAAMGLLPAGSYAVRNFCSKNLSVAESADPVLADLCFDPQTSGGLLAALPASRADDAARALQDAGLIAAVVGRVVGTHTNGKISLV